ncbi:MAG: hypothetical protein JNL72_14280 [Flavipsychrobacter sp.]|nr:hypothetical protein [Flavipsychrobacter sp.]
MRFLFLILFILGSLAYNAEAHECSYYLKGKILSYDGQVVGNTQCTLQLGKNRRIFKTDNEGNYFVEVFFTVSNVCRQTPEGKPSGDEYALSKEANSDTIIISCNMGVGYVKSNWDQYYHIEQKDYSKAHRALWSYKEQNLIERADITLNPAYPKLKEDNTDGYMSAIKRTLKKLNSSTKIDSLKLAANGLYTGEGRFRLRNGEVITRTIDSTNKTTITTASGTDSIIYGLLPDQLYKYILELDEIRWAIQSVFNYIELRNRPINCIFSDEFLGDCRNIVSLQKMNNHLYHLPENAFKKESSYFSINVDDNNIITDVFYYEIDTQ